MLLVVEDHADTREMLRRMLAAVGGRVLVAEHGQAALDVLRAERRLPDAILLDLMMPVMDGFAFAQAISRQPEWTAIPIVAVTALSASEDFFRSFSEGFQAHLTKPVEPETLWDTLGRVIRSNRSELRREPPKPG